MLDAVGQPFSLYLAEDSRIGAMLAIAELIDDRTVATALAPLEPDVPFTFPVLTRRAAAYTALGHPLAGRASADLDAFLAGQPRAVMPVTLGEEPEAPDAATPASHD
jgi:hypothetical protein